MVFKNRVEAGQKLARSLKQYRQEDVIIYGLPRGGVVVGAEVARYLGAPLDLVIPRKIGHPANAEYAIGAVTETGEPAWNEAEARKVDETWLKRQVVLMRAEAKRRRISYWSGQQPQDPRDKTVILVDDGIATGLTMIAAINELSKHHPHLIVVAVPVAPSEIPIEITARAQVVVLYQPLSDFGAVGQYYQEFAEVSGEEVRQLMNAYRQEMGTEPLDLAALNAVLATVETYPVASDTLAKQARRLHSAATVVEFFESIPGDITFADKADVMRRAEEVELTMEDEQNEPEENLRDYG